MRKIAVSVLLLCVIFPVFARADQPFRVGAKAAVLIDALSGRILFAQNEHEMLPMASTTKIMTALLALENSSLDEQVTAGPNAAGVPGTSIYLSEGETISMEHMLYGLLLRSGNDAAVAIAEHIAGDADSFAEMMNERAEELGAEAHYANPHGLDAEGHCASALGLAKIMRECMQNDVFRTITATRIKTIPWENNNFSRLLQNKNRLLSSYEGANGGKTGYTSKAGRCLVFSAERDELPLIGVVLGCPSWFETASAMLDYGFQEFYVETVFAGGDPVCEIPVTGGTKRSVKAAADTDLRFAARDSEHFSVEYIPDSVQAPVLCGQIVGTAVITVDGVQVASCALTAAENVPCRSLSATMLDIIRLWPIVG